MADVIESVFPWAKEEAGKKFITDTEKFLILEKESSTSALLSDYYADNLRVVKKDKEGKPKKTVRQALGVDEKQIITRAFPEYNLTFSANSLECHGSAAATRYLISELAYHRLGSRNATIVDVGGNFLYHVKEGHTNVHCCCPTLDVRDAVREQDRTRALQLFRPTPANLNQVAAHNLWKICPSMVRCKNKAQDCYFPCNAIMAIDAVYDISPRDFAIAMHAHNASQAIVSFMSDDRMTLGDTSGTIDELRAHWTIDHKHDIVEFSFESDPSMGYRHTYSNYYAWVTTLTLEIAGYSYLFESMDSRLGNTIVKVSRVFSRGIPSSTLFKRIWHPSNTDMLRVKVFKSDINRKHYGAKASVCKYIYVPKRLYDRTMKYAYGLSDKDYGLQGIYNYAKSQSSCITTDGVSFTSPVPIDSDDLQMLATTIFIRGAFNRVDQAKTASRLRSGIKVWNDAYESNVVASSFKIAWQEVVQFFKERSWFSEYRAFLAEKLSPFGNFEKHFSVEPADLFTRVGNDSNPDSKFPVPMWAPEIMELRHCILSIQELAEKLIMGPDNEMYAMQSDFLQEARNIYDDLGLAKKRIFHSMDVDGQLFAIIKGDRVIPIVPAEIQPMLRKIREAYNIGENAPAVPPSADPEPGARNSMCTHANTLTESKEHARPQKPSPGVVHAELGDSSPGLVVVPPDAPILDSIAHVAPPLACKRETLHAGDVCAANAPVVAGLSPAEKQLEVVTNVVPNADFRGAPHIPDIVDALVDSKCLCNAMINFSSLTLFFNEIPDPLPRTCDAVGFDAANELMKLSKVHSLPGLERFPVRKRAFRNWHNGDYEFADLLLLTDLKCMVETAVLTYSNATTFLPSTVECLLKPREKLHIRPIGDNNPNYEFNYVNCSLMNLEYVRRECMERKPLDFVVYDNTVPQKDQREPHLREQCFKNFWKTVFPFFARESSFVFSAQTPFSPQFMNIMRVVFRHFGKIQFVKSRFSDRMYSDVFVACSKFDASGGGSSGSDAVLESVNDSFDHIVLDVYRNKENSAGEYSRAFSGAAEEFYNKVAFPVLEHATNGDNIPYMSLAHYIRNYHSVSNNIQHHEEPQRRILHTIAEVDTESEYDESDDGKSRSDEAPSSGPTSLSGESIDEDRHKMCYRVHPDTRYSEIIVVDRPNIVKINVSATDVNDNICNGTTIDKASEALAYSSSEEDPSGAENGGNIPSEEAELDSTQVSSSDEMIVALHPFRKRKLLKTRKSRIHPLKPFNLISKWKTRRRENGQKVYVHNTRQLPSVGNVPCVNNQECNVVLSRQQHMGERAAAGAEVQTVTVLPIPVIATDDVPELPKMPARQPPPAVEEASENECESDHSDAPSSDHYYSDLDKLLSISGSYSSVTNGSRDSTNSGEPTIFVEYVARHVLEGLVDLVAAGNEGEQETLVAGEVLTVLVGAVERICAAKGARTKVPASPCKRFSPARIRGADSSSDDSDGTVNTTARRKKYRHRRKQGVDLNKQLDSFAGCSLEEVKTIECASGVSSTSCSSSERTSVYKPPFSYPFRNPTISFVPKIVSTASESARLRRSWSECLGLERIPSSTDCSLSSSTQRSENITEERELGDRETVTREEAVLERMQQDDTVNQGNPGKFGYLHNKTVHGVPKYAATCDGLGSDTLCNRLAKKFRAPDAAELGPKAQIRSRILEYVFSLERESANVKGNCQSMHESVSNSLKLIQKDRGKGKIKNLYNQWEGADFLFRDDDINGQATFTSKLKTNESYEVAWSGSQFVPIRFDKNYKVYTVANDFKIDQDVKLLVVTKDTKLFQAPKLIRALDCLDALDHNARVVLNEGVPGCGKSTHIVKNVKVGDLVLVQSRAACAELRHNIERKMQKDAPHVEVKTIDSWLLHSRTKAHTVWLDEGLMVHPGVIDVIAVVSKCTRMFIAGDRKQIPYINRIAGFRPRHDSYPFDEVKYFYTSHRVPQDVAALFAKTYQGLMRTTSKVGRSLNVIKCGSEKSILATVASSYDRVLVFTQLEKDAIKKKMGAEFQVNTIGESQGNTFNKVALVRMISKDQEIYKQPAQILVGMTRHRECFDYVTIVKNDAVCKQITASRQIDIEAFCVAHGHDQAPKENFTREVAVAAQTLDPVVNENAEIPFPECGDPVAVLQEFLEDMKPRGCVESVVEHPTIVANSDLQLQLADVKVDMSKWGVNAPVCAYQSKGFLPKLRTAQPEQRPHTPAEVLLALMKRNLNLPLMSSPTSYRANSIRAFEKFKSNLCVPRVDALLADMRKDCVKMSQHLLETWHSELPVEKAKLLDYNKPFDESMLTRYMLNIKKDVKNDLTPDSVEGYAALQTVIYLEKTVNIMFGPIVKAITERLINILKPNVYVHTRKNYSHMTSFLRNNLSSDVKYHIIELDQSKFDKSQGPACIDLAYYVMEQLGFDPVWIEIYRMASQSTSAADQPAGVKFYQSFQQRSGCPQTLLANTIVNMVACASTFDHAGMVAAFFVGDDVVYYFDQRPFDIDQACGRMSVEFNLSPKLIAGLTIAMFCCCFFVRGSRGYVAVPDIFKKIEKLGKSIKTDNGTELQDRFASLRDSMKYMRDYAIMKDYATAMRERYNDSRILDLAVSAMLRVSDDYDQFAKLYKKASVGHSDFSTAISHDFDSVSRDQQRKIENRINRLLTGKLL